jgi:response regulator RpfG family c-di-GMP phosphodiesterase
MEKNILGLKKIIINDTIWNKYKLKLKNKDLKIIKKYVDSINLNNEN